MKSLLKKLPLVLLGALLMLGAHASAAIQGAADYRSSLVSGITSSATSLSVVATSTPTGENLVPGSVYGLKLGGREYVLGLLSANKQFTSLIRNVSNITGTTTAGIGQPWGRGTAVEITDAPVLLEIINKLSGHQYFDNVLRYTGIATSTLAVDGNNLASVDYVNSVAFGAVPQASETAAGFSELSTQTEAALGTSVGGTGARLVLGGNLATSTYNSATSPSRVVVTTASGKIDNNFIATSTLLAATSTINIGSFPAWQIGKQQQIITTTGTSTFSVPSGITKLLVQVVGAGGAGAGTNNNQYAIGGGAGGCAFETVDVTGTSTIQTFVGTAGAGVSNSSGGNGGWSTFGTNGFYLSATGGIGGVLGGTTPTAPGIGANGDINLPGSPSGVVITSQGSNFYSGSGGASCLGPGGTAVYGNSASAATAGNNAVSPGAGGSGSLGGSASGAATGGSGANGFLRITW